MTTEDRTRAIAWFEKQSKCLAMPGAARMFGLAAEALNAQRWIPVSERLPELPEGTYCSVECNVIAAGNKPFATSMYYERTTRRGKAVERWMWHDRMSPWEVTHWQPLPQPPQKGE